MKQRHYNRSIIETFFDFIKSSLILIYILILSSWILNLGSNSILSVIVPKGLLKLLKLADADKTK